MACVRNNIVSGNLPNSPITALLVALLVTHNIVLQKFK